MEVGRESEKKCERDADKERQRESKKGEKEIAGERRSFRE